MQAEPQVVPGRRELHRQPRHPGIGSTFPLICPSRKFRESGFASAPPIAPSPITPSVLIVPIASPVLSFFQSPRIFCCAVIFRFTIAQSIVGTAMIAPIMSPMLAERGAAGPAPAGTSGPGGVNIGGLPGPKAGAGCGPPTVG
ncbi:MAG: hypothetical protein U0841_14240 [Chloroflexia bacterium]